MYISDPALGPAAIKTLTRLAVDAGAERLVLLRGAATEARSAEERFHAAAPFGTVLRRSRLAQDFSEGEFAAGVARGEVVLQAGDAAAEPFVDADDVADVAVAALTEDRHRGRTYELTGPRLLHAADAIAEIAAVLGRPVRADRGEEAAGLLAPERPSTGERAGLPRRRPRARAPGARLRGVRPRREGGRHVGRAGRRRRHDGAHRRRRDRLRARRRRLVHVLRLRDARARPAAGRGGRRRHAVRSTSTRCAPPLMLAMFGTAAVCVAAVVAALAGDGAAARG